MNDSDDDRENDAPGPRTPAMRPPPRRQLRKMPDRVARLSRDERELLARLDRGLIGEEDPDSGPVASRDGRLALARVEQMHRSAPPERTDADLAAVEQAADQERARRKARAARLLRVSVARLQAAMDNGDVTTLKDLASRLGIPDRTLRDRRSRRTR